MMKYKVKEILFVATLYDAFVLENEDSFFEQFMGEIYQYSLFSLPRITGVTNDEQALQVIGTTNFDMIILMGGRDPESADRLSRALHEKREDIPIYLLLNQKGNIKLYEDIVSRSNCIDKLFIWSGHSEIFFSIVKSIEDMINAENDTRIGLVRIILLIEDSPLYYSKFLQALYTVVFGQVQQLLPEFEKNELDKISKMRSRPKILHARNYDEAVFLFNKYRDFMLCVISDVEFESEGRLDSTAGLRFTNYARSIIKNLPIILHSSDPENKEIANKYCSFYIDKNSKDLQTDLKNFLTNYLYFGDFYFRNKNGETIAVAKSLHEFENLLQEIPDESFMIHASDNQFSPWLLSRGEIQLARSINPVRVKDFATILEARQFFINKLRQYKEEKKRGKILSYDETATLDEKNIVSFASGSLGGKGRGLAFINALIYNIDFDDISSEINIRTPITVVIGTDEFDKFMTDNHLYHKIFNSSLSYSEIKHLFVRAHLSTNLLQKLTFFLEQIDKPIAVRSSSISEDSLSQPFAGVFDTFVVTNNDSDKSITLDKLIKAIKLVYASIYSDHAKIYFEAIQHPIEEERMAIVLQELVGNQYEQYYYPHISGTAQSYNYYPIAKMQPEEGFALAAVGLGYYVVGGQKSYRFSPRYPKIQPFSTKDLINSTQVKFMAVDMSRKELDYIGEGEMAPIAQLDISEAEKHGTLTHCASVYNIDNDTIEVDLSKPGPRIINFANILKFNYIPLAGIIENILATISESLGSPVEIEYSVDLNPSENGLPSFYLLQIKPLVGMQTGVKIDNNLASEPETVLFTQSALGNGIREDICDLIFVRNQNFDRLKTLEMVKEIEILNRKMGNLGRKYILIGPGRWGSRDQFLGIPVAWPQISNAAIIVEISLENFPLDASLGSHFFHNITSMNVGYFSVLDSSSSDFIKWDTLYEQNIIEETNFFCHIRFNHPLKILMDGRKRTAIIQVTKE
ncbi:MAG: pyruvate, phosphate dikinase [Bacteroidales bacterium]|nr:pyruvate, phosphate dikinase [Bacteroidales bacterium]MBN2820250.1 pyruvate, phosphate dikinase [Bacteroidales bacterium]